MKYQPNFFEAATCGGGALKPSAREIRRKKIEQAFANSDAAFRAEYRQFVLDFAETHETFIIEDATLEYKKSGKIQPRDFRATGGIVQKMMAAGELKETNSYRKSKIRGAPMMVYTKGRPNV